MMKPATIAYEFGPFRLDAAGRRLLRRGRPVALTPKLFDILLLLVSNSGELVSKETLMKEIWPDSFVEENNLTVSISSLRKTLGERHRERGYIETVSKRGYRFAVRVRPVKADETGGRNGHHPEPVGEPAREESDEAEGALAVLPFMNAGESADLAYLSDGITESIINSMSRLPRLRLMARSTVFRYQGRDVDAQQVGRELNVRTVLAGRLREWRGRLLLAVELVDARDGSLIWGESYNRPLSDILTVQEEIAGELSGKLKIKLTSEERRRLTARHTQSSEVYRLYLKGRDFWNKRTHKDIERAERYFEESLGREPDFALARAGLADCYLSLIFLNALPVGEGVPAVRREAGEALALDETISEAHATLGYAELLALDWDAAGEHFRRAIELSPNNALARTRYAFYLAAHGRHEESIAQGERALVNDPLSPHTHVSAGRLFYYARKYERAIRLCRQALEIEPTFGPAHGLLGLVHERRGEYDEAIAEMLRALDILGRDPEALGLLGYLYAVAGRPREARRVLAELLKLSKQKYTPPLFVACLYAGLHDTAKAFEWLERTFEERAYVPILSISPLFDTLRQDPRFADLLRRSGFPAAQRKTTS